MKKIKYISLSVTIMAVVLLWSCNGSKPQPQQPQQQSQLQSQSTLARLVSELRGNTPAEMSQALKWIDITCDERANEVTYTFEWLGDVDGMTAKAFGSMKSFFIDLLLDNPEDEFRQLVIENNATIVVNIVLPDGDNLAKIVIKSDDYRHLR
ncbi:MAG: hypothetical protein J6N71_08390 [Muribaculaceae bacterium]|nr:hypothetical protein [Muribaculaceae bacterium]